MAKIKKGDKVVYDPPNQISTSDHLPTVNSYDNYMKKHKHKGESDNG